MALIKCPECAKEISDKADVCVNCGFPIKKFLEQQNKNEKVNIQMEQMRQCPSCHKENKIGSGYCAFCGFRLTQNACNKIAQPIYNQQAQQSASLPKVFNGVYRYTLLGRKQEVYCPRCGSWNCSHYHEQRIIPGKTKTRYTANLNPFHPLTFVNKKEKVVRDEQVVTENKFVCNSCGKIFH